MAWVALLFGWAAVTSVIGLNLAYFVPALGGVLAAKAVAAFVVAVISYGLFERLRSRRDRAAAVAIAARSGIPAARRLPERLKTRAPFSGKMGR